MLKLLLAALVVSLPLLAHYGPPDGYRYAGTTEPAPPFPMTLPTAPQFPARDFDVRDYGAVPDGRTLNTRAFARGRRVFARPQDFMRPQFIEPIDCHHVLVEGIRIVSGPFWTLQFVYCDQVIARNLTIRTSGSNTDGIDLDSCRGAEGCGTYLVASGSSSGIKLIQDDFTSANAAFRLSPGVGKDAVKRSDSAQE